MNHIVSTILILAASLLVMNGVQDRWTREERPFVWLSYVGHVVSAFALLGVYTFIYKGAGDIFAYERYGLIISEVVAEDPLSYVPEMAKGFLRWESDLDPYIYSPGSATGAMTIATAMGMFVTGGSLVGCCLIFSLMSLSSKLALYVALRPHFHVKLHTRLLVGCLLTPSAVFWTAGVVKEALACFGLGWAVLGLSMLHRGRDALPGVLFTLVGVVFIFSIKPYIVMPLGVASGLFVIAYRLKQQQRSAVALLSNPLYVVLGAGVIAGTFWLIGEVAPRFSVSEIAEEAARLQAYSRHDRGGSTFEIGSGEATTLGAQVGFAPVALINSLFRPFIFEVHNAVALVNALETTMFTLLLMVIMVKRGIKRTFEAILSVPGLLFCTVFFVLCGVGVGLGTTNLGTLSRYRVPLMPFYFASLLLLIPYGLLPGDSKSTARQ